MLKVIDKYSHFGERDNSHQSLLFLKKRFSLLVILGWEIRQDGVESEGGLVSCYSVPRLEWSYDLGWRKPKDF